MESVWAPAARVIDPGGVIPANEDNFLQIAWKIIIEQKFDPFGRAGAAILDIIEVAEDVNGYFAEPSRTGLSGLAAAQYPQVRTAIFTALHLALQSRLPPVFPRDCDKLVLQGKPIPGLEDAMLLDHANIKPYLHVFDESLGNTVAQAFLARWIKCAREVANVQTIVAAFESKKRQRPRVVVEEEAGEEGEEEDEPTIEEQERIAEDIPVKEQLTKEEEEQEKQLTKEEEEHEEKVEAMEEEYDMKFFAFNIETGEIGGEETGELRRIPPLDTDQVLERYNAPLIDALKTLVDDAVIDMMVLLDAQGGMINVPSFRLKIRKWMSKSGRVFARRKPKDLDDLGTWQNARENAAIKYDKIAKVRRGDKKYYREQIRAIGKDLTACMRARAAVLASLFSYEPAEIDEKESADLQQEIASTLRWLAYILVVERWMRRIREGAAVADVVALLPQELLLLASPNVVAPTDDIVRYVMLPERLRDSSALINEVNNPNELKSVEYYDAASRLLTAQRHDADVVSSGVDQVIKSALSVGNTRQQYARLIMNVAEIAFSHRIVQLGGAPSHRALYRWPLYTALAIPLAAFVAWPFHIFSNPLAAQRILRIFTGDEPAQSDAAGWIARVFQLSIARPKVLRPRIIVPPRLFTSDEYMAEIPSLYKEEEEGEEMEEREEEEVERPRREPPAPRPQRRNLAIAMLENLRIALRTEPNVEWTKAVSDSWTAVFDGPVPSEIADNLKTNLAKGKLPALTRDAVNVDGDRLIFRSRTVAASVIGGSTKNPSIALKRFMKFIALDPATYAWIVIPPGGRAPVLQPPAGARAPAITNKQRLDMIEILGGSIPSQNLQEDVLDAWHSVLVGDDVDEDIPDAVRIPLTESLRPLLPNDVAIVGEKLTFTSRDAAARIIAGMSPDADRVLSQFTAFLSTNPAASAWIRIPEGPVVAPPRAREKAEAVTNLQRGAMLNALRDLLRAVGVRAEDVAVVKEQIVAAWGAAGVSDVNYVLNNLTHIGKPDGNIVYVAGDRLIFRTHKAAGIVIGGTRKGNPGVVIPPFKTFVDENKPEYDWIVIPPPASALREAKRPRVATPQIDDAKRMAAAFIALLYAGLKNGSVRTFRQAAALWEKIDGGRVKSEVPELFEDEPDIFAVFVHLSTPDDGNVVIGRVYAPLVIPVFQTADEIENAGLNVIIEDELTAQELEEIKALALEN